MKIPAALRLSGVAALCALLTACPRPTPPPTPATILEFTFPATTDTGLLRLAALAFGEAGTAPVTVGSGYVRGSGAKEVSGGQVYVYPFELNRSLQGACLSPFKGGETAGMKDVVVSPDTVQTCNVYFVLFNDLNRNGQPESTEELYQTHSIYSYASEAFTYSFTSPDGNSVESGVRRKGWSLVAHEVRQPSATPGKYVVTMNSVPAADERLPVRLHEPTNRLISQGLGGAK
ncbi:hypothetical protein [Deinococcus sedimenti]|uniref:Lipoprotein n=1 Tax=Deinococcus sedimenti TaxID=1867090 RepID=A0ABQ2SA99_9DEIO|nr:hypothetical protein [Deinococcus sedimenti]GGS11416.1 hypothetical protein GCM10008960_41680 [Deinococcus sedimenti]